MSHIFSNRRASEAKPRSIITFPLLSDAVIGKLRCLMKQFTLEYWMDDGWYVGRLIEIPTVMSQGETLAELKENIRDAYELVSADPVPRHTELKDSLTRGIRKQLGLA